MASMSLVATKLAFASTPLVSDASSDWSTPSEPDEPRERADACVLNAVHNAMASGTGAILLTGDCGSNSRSSPSTVSPPTPESNSRMGESWAG